MAEITGTGRVAFGMHPIGLGLGAAAGAALGVAASRALGYGGLTRSVLVGAAAAGAALVGGVISAFTGPPGRHTSPASLSDARVALEDLAAPGPPAPTLHPRVEASSGRDAGPTSSPTTAAPEPVPEMEETQEPGLLGYTVREDDTLATIAARHFVSEADLRALNPRFQDGGEPEPGEHVDLGDGPVKRPENGTEYRVRRGDTLTRIAEFFCVPVRELQVFNDLSDSTIITGQIVRIPARDEAPEPATPKQPEWLTSPTPPAPSNPADPTKLDNVRTVAWVSQHPEYDVPHMVRKGYRMSPIDAVAVMLWESSKGNERAVGDNGTSIGLFQLNLVAGKAKSVGLSREECFDPLINARVGVHDLSRVAHFKPHLSAGQQAVLSQKPHPRVREQYVRMVNELRSEARELLLEAGVVDPDSLGG